MSVAVDRESLLVSAEGGVTLEAVERALAARGLTLGVDTAAHAMTLAAWLGAGCPGAPSAFADPADHLLAGLEATLANGRALVVHPSPRRAVGPDLVALVLGAGGRFARVTRAWLRAHELTAARPAAPLPAVDLDPPVSDGEARLLDAIARELV